MSEVESNQETNGTSNGDVPEIELIIKEEFMLEYEIVGNANEHNINKVAAGDGLNDVDEKENMVKSNLQLKELPHQQHIKEYKTTTDIGKSLALRKDAFAKRRNEFSEGGNVLMLTHHDNQHFQFEYVTSKQEENVLDSFSAVEEHSKCFKMDEKQNSENLPVNNMTRAAFAQKHMKEEIEINEFSGEDNRVSNLDFATMVAEACDGIFDDIENDLRTYNNSSETNSCHGNGQFPDSGCNEGKCVVKRKKRAHNSEAVQQAVNAVLEGGMTLGEAAKCYNVVRSTVSSRVAKHPKRKRRKSNKQLEELIYSKLKDGVQISEISRSLHVPKSTVHLYKTRLKNNGLLPPVWFRNGSKDMVDHGVQERLKQAYRGHIVNGMSVRFAAEFFSLPLTTLWRYIKRRKGPVMNANDVDIAKSEIEEYTEGNSCIKNATTNDFKDVKIEGNLHINEMKSPATYATDLETVVKKEQTIEQSLIDQLLE